MSRRDGNAVPSSPETQDPSDPASSPRSRSNSKVLAKPHGLTRSHQEYLNSLIPPTKEQFHRIEMVQAQKEEEILRKRLSMGDEWSRAAETIQRSYRGYRTRRQMRGIGLDPNSRWVDAIREAKYRNILTPKARSSYNDTGSELGVGQGHPNGGEQLNQSFARQNWRKIVSIAKRATRDEDSDLSTDDDDDEDFPEEEREQRRRRRAEQKAQRQREAQTLDLQYWLEMVDLQHRYGSNLRVYHSEWKKIDTNENFFYWLDYGAGRFIDCQGCPRERLDREKVRYLSREERMAYLVKIDKEGRLRWAKNNVRIDTTVKYKDSIHGIVPVEDSSPPYVPPDEEIARDSQECETTTGSDGTGETATISSHEDKSTHSGKYDTLEAHRMKKTKSVSASMILDKLLRGSVRKNTWIFVADTSFRLYAGIKQTGIFQHSSFMHGSRISAAGLIKIKDGRLDKLSPLSGHYRPPASSFRAFLHSLREAGADLSHLSISRSYLLLVGLEAYVKTRRRGERLVQALIHGRDRLLNAHGLHLQHEGDLAWRQRMAADGRMGEVREGAKHDQKGNDSDENTTIQAC